MPLMLLESQAIRAGISKGEIELARTQARPVPKGVILPAKMFQILKEGQK